MPREGGLTSALSIWLMEQLLCTVLHVLYMNRPLSLKSLMFALNSKDGLSA